MWINQAFFMGGHRSPENSRDNFVFLKQLPSILPALYRKLGSGFSGNKGSKSGADFKTSVIL
uniref:Uncharacterized protein n=1 Tax=Romanomermis culicivorax TaxID=13658 RepID=A0A915HNQ0_ROMCU